MTSGVFETIPIASIHINREKRQRREFTIEDLLESIPRIGLIHPPVVTREGELVAGERRLTACRALGWTSIPVQWAEDLDEIQLTAIELEENVKRKDLTWQEESEALLSYHRLKIKIATTEWDMVKTAEDIGMSPTYVRNRCLVAEELEKGNEFVASAPKFSTAYGIVERARSREKAADLKSVSVSIPGAEPEDTAEIQSLADLGKTHVPLINMSFHEWQPEYRGQRFNFIHCDFPYGVSADKHDQGASSSFGGYEDSFQTYVDLLDRLEDAMENVISDSAHLMFWFAMDHYVFTKTRLESMGWVVNPYPLVWHKSDNSGILPDPKRGPRRVYETAFIATRNDRLIVRSTSNVVAHANDKDIHMSEKPRGMLRKFFAMFVDTYTVMLDPTCGSGNSVRVAQDLGAETVFGLEQNEEFFNLAKEHYHD